MSFSPEKINSSGTITVHVLTWTEVQQVRMRLVPRSESPCWHWGHDVLLSLILILQLSPQTKGVCELDFPPFLIWAIFSFSLKKLIALLKYTIVSCFLKGFASVMRIKAPITVLCTPNFVTVTRPRLTPSCAALICRGRRDTGRGRLRHGSTQQLHLQTSLPRCLSTTHLIGFDTIKSLRT